MLEVDDTGRFKLSRDLTVIVRPEILKPNGLADVQIPAKTVGAVDQQIDSLLPMPRELVKHACMWDVFSDAMLLEVLSPDTIQRSETAAIFQDLVDSWIFEKLPRVPVDIACCTPGAESITCYRFVSKLLQRQVKSLWLEQPLGELVAKINIIDRRRDAYMEQQQFATNIQGKMARWLGIQLFHKDFTGGRAGRPGRLSLEKFDEGVEAGIVPTLQRRRGFRIARRSIPALLGEDADTSANNATAVNKSNRKQSAVEDSLNDRTSKVIQARREARSRRRGSEPSLSASASSSTSSLSYEITPLSVCESTPHVPKRPLDGTVAEKLSNDNTSDDGITEVATAGVAQECDRSRLVIGRRRGSAKLSPLPEVASPDTNLGAKVFFAEASCNKTASGTRMAGTADRSAYKTDSDAGPMPSLGSDVTLSQGDAGQSDTYAPKASKIQVSDKAAAYDLEVTKDAAVGSSVAKSAQLNNCTINPAEVTDLPEQKSQGSTKIPEPVLDISATGVPKNSAEAKEMTAEELRRDLQTAHQQITVLLTRMEKVIKAHSAERSKRIGVEHALKQSKTAEVAERERRVAAENLLTVEQARYAALQAQVALSDQALKDEQAISAELRARLDAFSSANSEGNDETTLRGSTSDVNPLEWSRSPLRLHSQTGLPFRVDISDAVGKSDWA